MKGTKGTNFCDVGYEVITNEYECFIVQSSFNMKWHTTGVFSTSPKGCSTSEWSGHGVFLNTHNVGGEHPSQSRICKRRGIPLLIPNYVVIIKPFIFHLLIHDKWRTMYWLFMKNIYCHLLFTDKPLTGYF